MIPEPALAPEPEILTAQEVAALLRCSDQQVYDKGRQGIIPGYFRVGKLVRFHRSAILAYLAGLAEPAPVS